MLHLRLSVVSLLAIAAINCYEARPPQQPAPARGSVAVHVTGGDRALLSTSIDSPGRRTCTAVMVIAAEAVRVDEQVLTALEGHFLLRGLRVVSSAITGRVVSSADARGQIEGAAKLPALERALVLAKGANAECVFYLLDLEIGKSDRIRHYVWRDNEPSLAEVDKSTFDATPPHRRWFVGGPIWRIEGKVVDVNTGAILSIISLTHSTPFAADRELHVSFFGTSLVPHYDQYGWRYASPAELDILRTSLMSRLAVEVRGSGP